MTNEGARAPKDEIEPTTEPRPDAERPERGTDESSGIQPGKWVKKTVWILVLLILGWIAYKLAAAYFPRKWADFIGGLVDGRVSYGTMWGLFFGFTFTLIPLLVLFQVRRHFLNWLWRGIIALVAVVLALPNLLTLSVVAGTNNAAHAGERIFDVEGVGFRNASLIGVIVGAVVAFLILFVDLRLASRKKKVKKLEAERDELRSERPGSRG